MSKFDPRLKKKADLCGVTRKRRWRSRPSAQDFASGVSEVALRPYYCILCGGYHLTSRPYEISLTPAEGGALARRLSATSVGTRESLVKLTITTTGGKIEPPGVDVWIERSSGLIEQRRLMANGPGVMLRPGDRIKKFTQPFESERTSRWP